MKQRHCCVLFRPIRTGLAILALHCFPAGPAAAQSRWTGASDALWNNSTNWQDGTLPAAGSNVLFDAAGTTNLDTTLGQDFSIESLTVLDPAGPVGINGNALTLGAGGVDLSSATQDLTIGSAVILPSPQTWAVQADRTLLVTGVVSGAGDLIKAGNGTLTLRGANTRTASTSISAGVLKMQGLAFWTATQNLAIAAGAVLNLDGNTGLATGMSMLSGLGTLRVTGGSFCNENPNSPVGSGRNVSFLLGSGALMDVQAGAAMKNGGWQSCTWTDGASWTNLADLNVDGTFDVWDGKPIYLDTLIGTGLVQKTQGTGVVNVCLGTDNGVGTFWGKVNGNGVAFYKIGAGTQTLAGTLDNNSMVATVSSGVLILAKTSSASVHSLGGSGVILTINDGALAQLGGTGNEQLYYQGDVAINAGGAFDMNGLSEGFDGLACAGVITNSVAATTSTLTVGEHGTGGSVTGNIAGNIAFAKTGAGVLTVSGACTYSGATAVNGGTLVLSNGTDRLPSSTTLTLANTAGVTLDLGGNDQAARWLAGGGTTGGTVANSSGTTNTLTLNLLSCGVRTFSGAINGNVRVAVLNSNAKNTDCQIFVGANTYSGGTLISNGQLRATDDAQLGAVPATLDPANIVIRDGGVLQNNNSYLTISATRGITIESGDGWFYTGWTKDITNNAPISGAGRLVKCDSGRLVLNAPCPLSGDTVIGVGPGTGFGGGATIVIGHTDALSNSTFDASFTAGANSGTLDLNNLNVALGGLKGAGATIANFTQTLTVGGNGQSTTFSGALNGTGALIKTGPGTLTLAGGSGFSGNVTLSEGMLRCAAVNGLGASSNLRTITVNAGLTLEVAKDNFFGGHMATNVPTIVIGSGATVVNTAAANSALNNVVLNGGTLTSTAGSVDWGAWDVNGTVTATGQSAITTTAVGDTGRMLLASGTGASSTTIHVAAAGDRLTISTAIQNGRDGESPYNVHDTGITKTGDGALALTGANTYTGVTQVQGGVLLANNPVGSATGAGTVRLGTGGTLGGTGAVAGVVTVSADGALQPGDGGGTLTLNGGLTLLNGSILQFGVGTNGTLARVAGGQLTGAGMFGTRVVVENTGGMEAGTTYTLMDWTGAVPIGVQPSSFTLQDHTGFVNTLRIVGSRLILTPRTGAVLQVR